MHQAQHWVLKRFLQDITWRIIGEYVCRAAIVAMVDGCNLVCSCRQFPCKHRECRLESKALNQLIRPTRGQI